MSKSANEKSSEFFAPEAIAIEALSFIAQDEKLLERFVALSGIKPESMREAARASGFLAGVLGFLLSHEPDLLAFCAYADRKPENVQKAFAALPGGGADYSPCA